MIKAAIKRPAWEDRYVRPSLDQLIAGMANQALAELVTVACDAFGSQPHRSGSVSWQGVPWRWAIAFRSEDESRPFAYVVPQPSKPLAVVTLTIDLIRGLPIRKLSKSVKDPIIFAPQVGELLWPTWELTSKSMVAEIASIADHKLSAACPTRSGAA